jgi:Icc-related predicted phosphoesterase
MNPFTLHDAKRLMNDFQYIRNGDRKLIPEDCFEWHKKTVSYIREVAQDNRDKKVIVATHHAPTFLSIHPKYKDELQGAYASDLSDLILDEENIVLWIHGHTHDMCEYEVGNCKVICNPKGYLEFADYRCKVIEL